MDGEIVGISKNARYLFGNQLMGILEMPTNFTKSTHLIHYRFMIDGVRIMISDFPKKKGPSQITLQRALLILSRLGADSNRRTRFCRPLPNRSATQPY